MLVVVTWCLQQLSNEPIHQVLDNDVVQALTKMDVFICIGSRGKLHDVYSTDQNKISFVIEKF